MQELTAEEIINQLRTDKTFLNHKFGVVDIGFFGSFTKGQPSPESDIDLIFAGTIFPLLKMLSMSFLRTRAYYSLPIIFSM
ncbi:MAG: hypothetical protein FP816_07815 [Desulfobacteraceae bacterium]|nr:hypothetical protein [Desulfobacteraceae bacterium]